MAPRIVKQKKVLIKTENSSAGHDFSRLQASNTANLPIAATAELEDWDDDNYADNDEQGWNELDDENTKHMIRETRRQQRALRQQQMLKQKQLQSHQQGFAERLNSRQS